MFVVVTDGASGSSSGSVCGGVCVRVDGTGCKNKSMGFICSTMVLSQEESDMSGTATVHFACWF